ncbi:MAG: hypothetical protein AVDCRST_MAG76-1719, partial [uncultured Acidimicrobiales bacterium]
DVDACAAPAPAGRRRQRLRPGGCGRRRPAGQVLPGSPGDRADRRPRPGHRAGRRRALRHLRPSRDGPGPRPPPAEHAERRPGRGVHALLGRRPGTGRSPQRGRRRPVEDALGQSPGRRSGTGRRGPGPGRPGQRSPDSQPRAPVAGARSPAHRARDRGAGAGGCRPLQRRGRPAAGPGREHGQDPPPQRLPQGRGEEPRPSRRLRPPPEPL